MFDNLIVVVIIAAVLWLGGYAYYMYTSQQQRSIANDIEALEKKLQNSGSLPKGEDA